MNEPRAEPADSSLENLRRRVVFTRRLFTVAWIGLYLPTFVALQLSIPRPFDPRWIPLALVVVALAGICVSDLRPARRGVSLSGALGGSAP